MFWPALLYRGKIAGYVLTTLSVLILGLRHRLGHNGNGVTESYTHTFTQDERDAAEKLGEFFGTGWPEITKQKVISFPNLSQKEEGLPIGDSEALVNQ